MTDKYVAKYVLFVVNCCYILQNKPAKRDLNIHVCMIKFAVYVYRTT